MATLACDAGQTHRYARENWPYGSSEANPMLGAHPSSARVGVYFAGTVAALAVAGSLLPARLRPVLFGAVTAVEARTIVLRNMRYTPGVCGVGGEIPATW